MFFKSENKKLVLVVFFVFSIVWCFGFFVNLKIKSSEILLVKTYERKPFFLETLNQAILLIKNQYVKPSRVDIPFLFSSCLESLAYKFPELNVLHPIGNSQSVFIQKKIKHFNLLKISSFFNLNRVLEDLFFFIQENIFIDITIKKLEYLIINSIFQKLDSHSLFLNPRDSREILLSTGLVVSLQKGNLIVLKKPKSYTPAYKVGIKVFDIVVKINNCETNNMSLYESVEKMRGDLESTVNIVIARKKEKKLLHFFLIRSEIKICSVISKFLSSNIRYIKVKKFQDGTVYEIEKILDNKKLYSVSLRGLILDLRGNPGGLLSEAVAVSDLFLDNGVIVSTEGSIMNNVEVASNNSKKIKLPMIILINQRSASASEVVAGALKGNKRALIIGEQSYGKGSVQNLYKIESNLFLKMTIAKYFIPGNKSIEGIGVAPDVFLESIYIKNKNNIQMFINNVVDKKKQYWNVEKPFFRVKYLIADITKNQDIKNIIFDYYVLFANMVLKNTISSEKKEMLFVVKKFINANKKKEKEKLINTFNFLGINWSIYSINVGNVRVLLVKKIRKNEGLVYKTVKKISCIAGQNITISILLENLSSNVISRIHGTSISNISLFSNYEIVIGAMKKNEKKIVNITFFIPKHFLPQKALMKVYIKNNNKFSYGTINIPIEVLFFRRPSIKYNYIFTGKNNINLENKDVNLNVFLKNDGEVNLIKYGIVLESGLDIKTIIEKTRHKLKRVRPGEEIFVSFSFSIKDINFLLDNGLFLYFYDTTSGFFFKESVVLDSLRYCFNKKLIEFKYVLVKGFYSLFSNPKIDSIPIAFLNKGSKWLIIDKTEIFFKIKISNNICGFILKKNVLVLTCNKKNSESYLKNYNIFYNVQPAKILLGLQKRNPNIIIRKKYNLPIKIFSYIEIKDIFIFKKYEKFFFKSFFLLERKNIKLLIPVKLKFGLNIFDLVLRFNNGCSQKLVINIFSQ